MISMKTFLLGAFLTGALMGPALVQAEDTAPAAAPAQHERKMPGKAFEEADVNKDGMLDAEEFLSRHREKFQEIDADGNGSITAEEFKIRAEIMREKYKARKEKMDERDGTDETAAPAATDEKPAE